MTEMWNITRIFFHYLERIHKKSLKLSRRMNVLKSSRATSRVDVELKTNVSEISTVSIIRTDVVNDRMSLIFTPVCEIDASSYWCIMAVGGRSQIVRSPIRL
jgi:hypothetical protein